MDINNITLVTRRSTQAPRCLCDTQTPGLHASHCPLAAARALAAVREVLLAMPDFVSASEVCP